MKTGSSFGPYTLETTLGRGNSGDTYKGTDTLSGDAIVLRVLPSVKLSTLEVRRSFTLASWPPASVEHPHLAPLLDIGITEEDSPFLVTKYIAGDSLEQRFSSGNLSTESALALLEQVANALDHIHASALTHRNIKPSAIIIDEESEKAVLLELGVAALDDASLAPVGTVMGSTCYLAPEQLQAQPIDHRVDVFSLAAVAFEALTGQHPFPGGNFAAIVSNIMSGNLRTFEELQCTLPRAVEEVLRKALSLNREERPASCGDLMSTLQEACKSLSEAAPSTHGEKLAEPLPVPPPPPGIEPEAAPPPTTPTPVTPPRLLNEEVEIEASTEMPASVQEDHNPIIEQDVESSSSSEDAVTAAFEEEESTPVVTRTENPTLMDVRGELFEHYKKELGSSEPAQEEPALVTPEEELIQQKTKSLLKSHRTPKEPSSLLEKHRLEDLEAEPLEDFTTQRPEGITIEVDPEVKSYVPPSEREQSEAPAYGPPPSTGGGASTIFIAVLGIAVMGLAGGAGYIYLQQQKPKATMASKPEPTTPLVASNTLAFGELEGMTLTLTGAPNSISAQDLKDSPNEAVAGLAMDSRLPVEIRRLAIAELGSRETEEVVPVLLRTLSEAETPEIATDSLLALSTPFYFEYYEVMDTLYNSLNHPFPLVRGLAGRAVASSTHPQAAEALKARIDRESDPNILTALQLQLNKLENG